MPAVMACAVLSRLPPYGSSTARKSPPVSGGAGCRQQLPAGSRLHERIALGGQIGRQVELRASAPAPPRQRPDHPVPAPDGPAESAFARSARRPAARRRSGRAAPDCWWCRRPPARRRRHAVDMLRAPATGWLPPAPARRAPRRRNRRPLRRRGPAVQGRPATRRGAGAGRRRRAGSQPPSTISNAGRRDASDTNVQGRSARLPGTGNGNQDMWRPIVRGGHAARKSG